LLQSTVKFLSDIQPYLAMQLWTIVLLAIGGQG
jgi:hypothetical protein